MTAERPQRRTKTARELAEQFGISQRHVRRMIAEPRAEFLGRAAARRETAVRLRAQGLTYAQIAEETGIPVGTARRLVHEARKAAQAGAS